MSAQLLGRIALFVTCAVFIGACDEPAPPVLLNPLAPTDSLGVPTRAALETLAPLWPNTPTQIAVDRASGVVYFCQPSREGRDVVMQYGQRMMSETTALTAAAVGMALGQPELRGHFAALAGGADGKLYFLFKSAGGKQSTFAVGQYDPLAARIRILTDTAGLMRASNLGASIELANLTLIATDSFLWLQLAVLEESVMLRYDLKQLPVKDMIEPHRPFEKMTCGDEVLRPGGDRSRLSAGAGDNLLLLDTHAAGLFDVKPDGKAALLSTLVALPQRMSPGVLLGGGRVGVFVSESEEIRGSVAARLDSAAVRSSYPAILLFSPDGTITDIPRERLSARPGAPVYALRLSEAVRESEESFIAYDAASGELVRVRLAD